MSHPLDWPDREFEVALNLGTVELTGTLGLPPQVRGVVLFAHGSGSSRHSPRNRYVARMLQSAGFATLLIDLLTAEEEAIDDRTRHQLRFDIPRLARRLVGATDWLIQYPATRSLAIGYFGASTGSAAALVAAVERGDRVNAIVSRGGRPDLALGVLPQVRSPTLLIVGGRDFPVLGTNEDALSQLSAPKQLAIVPGATHLFEEPGALAEVARLACQWFGNYLAPARSPVGGKGAIEHG